MMIVPVLSTLIVGALMFFVIGVPIVWATEALTTFLTNLQGSGNFLFGAIVGGMAAFDFGGPSTKSPRYLLMGYYWKAFKNPKP